MSREKLRRPCKRCEKNFYPTGPACKICDACNRSIKRIEKGKIKEKYKVEYFSNKTKLDQLRDNMTLERWKILSKNYKLGKSIWGNRFTRVQLAKDMDMALTTVLRCLSLDKANERSWQLVKEGKISAFKLAMICSLKNNLYQDKIVDMVISSNLSTCRISKLKINNIEDINLERHRIAVEEGYSRKESAYRNFKTWISRGEMFLLLDVERLPADKHKELSEHLLRLNKKIERYEKKLSPSR